ncbi:MAG: hypothetical protein HY809_02750 [Nitrospirae bacterium]|nr:hypothetical protein [Nitrospirota bacterium]
MKNFFTASVFVLFLVFCITTYPAADALKSSAEIEQEIKIKMNAHIEKVKHKNPEKIQSLMQKTGNKITGCLSCHDDLLGNKNK